MPALGPSRVRAQTVSHLLGFIMLPKLFGYVAAIVPVLACHAAVVEVKVVDALFERLETR